LRTNGNLKRLTIFAVNHVRYYPLARFYWNFSQHSDGVRFPYIRIRRLIPICDSRGFHSGEIKDSFNIGCGVASLGRWFEVKERCFFETSENMYPGSSVIAQLIEILIHVYFNMTDQMFNILCPRILCTAGATFHLIRSICANSTLVKANPLNER
jgi:hypothetical protein